MNSNGGFKNRPRVYEFSHRNEMFHVGELGGVTSLILFPGDVNASSPRQRLHSLMTLDRLWILDSGKLAGRPVNKRGASHLCQYHAPYGAQTPGFPFELLRATVRSRMSA